MNKSRLAKSDMKTYAAKLLFQFRVVVDGASSKRRTTEERIILLKDKSARMALGKAKSAGKKSEFSYLNDDKNRVFFEFVGVMDLMHLGEEREKNEVWYEIKEAMKPMERKRRLLPAEKQLSAIKLEGAGRRGN